MGCRLDNNLYNDDIERSLSGIDFSSINGSRIMISGATGMVGSFIIDSLIKGVRDGVLSCEVIALGRSEEKARARLPYFGEPYFSFESIDVSDPVIEIEHQADVVIHLASTTHPRAYATQPIKTITSNINGLQHLLQHAGLTSKSRFVFASSVEVYGENRGDVELFDETYCGYLDCNTLRAGYPESKRLGEALCQAYSAEKGQEVYIPRLPRTFGPTVLPTDTKAVSQFISKAVTGDDIILKSQGNQLYSYLYVADVSRALLWMITKNLNGIAYNLASDSMNITLKDLAEKLAEIAKTQVVFKLPDEIESRGYSTATKAVMDGTLLSKTGWKPIFGLEESLEHTILVLKSICEVQ